MNLILFKLKILKKLKKNIIFQNYKRWANDFPVKFQLLFCSCMFYFCRCDHNFHTTSLHITKVNPQKHVSFSTSPHFSETIIYFSGRSKNAILYFRGYRTVLKKNYCLHYHIFVLHWLKQNFRALHFLTREFFIPNITYYSCQFTVVGSLLCLKEARGSRALHFEISVVGLSASRVHAHTCLKARVMTQKNCCKFSVTKTHSRGTRRDSRTAYIHFWIAKEFVKSRLFWGDYNEQENIGDGWRLMRN